MLEWLYQRVITLGKNYSTLDATVSKITKPIINNMNATAAPTANDDSDDGYGEGSTWVFNNIHYICTTATPKAAVWVSNENIYYFGTWAEAVAAISVAGTTYVNRFCVVANANGGPSAGVTFTGPGTAVDYIVDGGGATYEVLAQGTNYRVKCQPRTITNPVVTSVMLTPAAKPTVKGYYIFTVTPTNGLPAGVGLNDIAYYDGAAWTCYQRYAVATAVLVAGTSLLSQVTWRKFNGTWMSTADEYIPDGNEYQTGKLWNGKPVYRKCISGTTSSSIDNVTRATGISVPTTGTVVLCFATVIRSSGTRQTVGGGGNSVFGVLNTGSVIYNAGSDSSWGSIPYTVWVEYTKN